MRICKRCGEVLWWCDEHQEWHHYTVDLLCQYRVIVTYPGEGK